MTTSPKDKLRTLEGASRPGVRRYSESMLPTEYGTLQAIAYRMDSDDDSRSPIEHLAIVAAPTKASSSTLLRVHSECLTGEVLKSLKCDCGGQLDMALRRIALEGGVVLYLRQEGRGIGLGNKLRAYALQEQGHDTVDANRLLGFEDDERSYSMVPDMLEDLGVRQVALMTNNPAKLDALRELGVKVTSRQPHVIAPQAVSRAYLETKRARMGHLLSDDLTSDSESDARLEPDSGQSAADFEAASRRAKENAG